MLIRPAVAADAASIASIMNALLQTTTVEWRDEPHSVSAIGAWMGDHDCVLVAEERDEIIGFAAYGPFRDSVKWPGYRFAAENSVHVREDCWHRGVARELMEALITAAKENGKHSMIAAVDGANDASVRLHESLGFAEVARMPELGAKFGRWLDLVLLQLRLDLRPAPGDG